MRLWILSDLHLDANREAPLRLPTPRPQHDVVVLAGDICEGMATAIAWIEHEGLNARPVVYVPGNHEFYGTSLAEGLERGRAAARLLRNVHVLERDGVDIDGVRIVGATFWTDFRLYGDGLQKRSMQVAEQVMLDHRRIRQGAEGLFTPEDAVREHEAARAFIEAAATSQGGLLDVVVTHTAPSQRSIADAYRDNLMTAAFASRSEDLVARASLWVHGHTHIGCDYEISGCRVVNNPRGYVAAGEGRHFDPGFVVELSV